MLLLHFFWISLLYSYSINTSVTSNTDTPNKIYSRVNYPFPPPSSRTPSQSACQLSSGTLPYSFTLSSLKHFLTIATPPSLETLSNFEVPFSQINSTPLILAVLKTSPSKVDKSTPWCILQY